MDTTDAKSTEAIHAAADAAAAVERSRHAQITEIVEGAVKPIQEEQIRVRKVLEESQEQGKAIIATLASKEDIKDIKEFMKNVDLTFTVIRTSGKWGKTAILTVATIFVAIGIITGGLKAVIVTILGGTLIK